MTAKRMESPRLRIFKGREAYRATAGASLVSAVGEGEFISKLANLFSLIHFLSQMAHAVLSLSGRQRLGQYHPTIYCWRMDILDGMGQVSLANIEHRPCA
jgi:hypothetical protein